jgi:hypothetical protein
MKYLILFPMFFSLFGICYGENLYIDTVIMETSSGADLGNANAKEVMNDIFKLEKEILMQILPQLGIKFEKLSPKVKSKLLKNQTTNFEAFLAFAEGLEHIDSEQFQKASESFRKAIKLDPNFKQAAHLSLSMPEKNISVKAIGQLSMQEALINTQKILADSKGLKEPKQFITTQFKEVKEQELLPTGQHRNVDEPIELQLAETTADNQEAMETSTEQNQSKTLINLSW